MTEKSARDTFVELLSAQYGLEEFLSAEGKCHLCIMPVKNLCKLIHVAFSVYDRSPSQHSPD